MMPRTHPIWSPIEGLLIWFVLVQVAQCEHTRLDDPELGGSNPGAAH
jgi:hypothetical protein